MLKFLFSKFARDERGAVTTEYVVLVAAIVGLSVGVIFIVASGVTTFGNGLNATVESRAMGVN